MPRSFDVSVDSPASVEQVHAAFSAEDYWLARLATLNGSTTLESLVVDDDQTVRVPPRRTWAATCCPGSSPKFYRRDLKVRHTETWTTGGRSAPRGDQRRGVRGAGIRFWLRIGRAHANGSLLTLNGTVEFKVPLVGGTVESFIAREFAKGIPEIQDFTAKWVTEHA